MMIDQRFVSTPSDLDEVLSIASTNENKSWRCKVTKEPEEWYEEKVQN